MNPRNRGADSVEDKALKTFRRRKIMTLGEVAELIGRTIHTARRRLKQWRAHTSYNHNGRYYACGTGVVCSSPNTAT